MKKTETIKELIMTNPSKKAPAKKSPDKKPPAKKKTPSKRASAETLAPKTKTKTKPAQRRKNPEVSAGAAVKALIGGAIGQLVATPAAHLVGGRIANKTASGAVRTALAAGLPGVAGFALKNKTPNFAAGLLGAAGALGTGHLLATVAHAGDKPNALLEKAGFAGLAGPTIYERDGQLFRLRDDGIVEALAGLGAPEPVLLQLEDGTQMQAQLLGAFNHGGQDLSLVRAGEGLMLIPGISGLGDFVETPPGMAGPGDVPSSLGETVNVVSSLGGFAG